LKLLGLWINKIVALRVPQFDTLLLQGND